MSKFVLFVLKTLQVLVLGIYTELVRLVHPKEGVPTPEMLG